MVLAEVVVTAPMVSGAVAPIVKVTGPPMVIAPAVTVPVPAVVRLYTPIVRAPRLIGEVEPIVKVTLPPRVVELAVTVPVPFVVRL